MDIKIDVNLKNLYNNEKPNLKIRIPNNKLDNRNIKSYKKLSYINFFCCCCYNDDDDN